MVVTDTDLWSIYVSSLPESEQPVAHLSPLNEPSRNHSRPQVDACNEECLREDFILPAWTDTLSECLQTVSELPLRESDIRLVNGYSAKPQPFEKILLLFVEYAADRVKAQTGSCYHQLSDGAHEQVAHSLLVWLSYINALSMETEFSVFRATRHSGVNRWLTPGTDEGSTELYDAFIEHLHSDGLLRYFKKYPVLGRLTAKSIEIWVATTTEFLNRLDKDKQAIAQIFNEGHLPGSVTNIILPLSDRHHGGRSVAMLHFESGLRLVYKPKNIRIERAYNDLINWLNASHAPIDLKSFKVLDQNGYGWAECVMHQPHLDQQQAQAYYRRAGGLLFLVHVLCATDLHYENIIQQGEHPVLIDLETLLHPYVDSQYITDTDNAIVAAEKLINTSVLRTGFLPRWFMDNQAQAYDVSGLGQFMPQQYSIEAIKWRYINTDAMQARWENISVYANQADASSGSSDSTRLDQFANELAVGFDAMYSFFYKHKDHIARSAQWQVLANQTVRFVFRPTRVYSQVQHNSVQPTAMKNGANRSACLAELHSENLSISYDIPPERKPILAAEVASMEQLDIPLFSARTDNNTLIISPDQTLSAYFSEPSYQTATRRLLSLGERDKARQIEFIRGAIGCRGISNQHFIMEESSRQSAQELNLLTPQKAITLGKTIAERLRDQAVIAADGSMSWIAPRYFSSIKKFQLVPISNTLYDGTAGIGIFFAALYRVTGDEEYKSLALNTMAITQSQIETAKKKPGFALGGYAAYSGVLYSLHTIGQLTNTPRLIDVAFNAAMSLDNGSFESDQSYDIMYGSAGTILALLPIYEHQPKADLLKTLCAAGDHLISSRTLTETGFQSWPSPDQIFLAGFSHGAAGIAYALLRLYEVTGTEIYKEAALDAILYEDSVLCHSEGNWPDFRRDPDAPADNPASQSFMCSWCHGAPGIGMARLSNITLETDTASQRDIQLAVSTTKRYLNSSADHMCCGNFGRLELLLMAGMNKADSTLLEFALSKAGEIVELAESTGDFRYNSHLGATPGFFQGISGIGYQLLRLTHPLQLPSVLTFR